MKKLVATIAIPVLALCLYGFKLTVDSQPELLLIGAAQESTKGQLVRFILKNIATVDWNRPTEYGELYLNMLVANCNPWTEECADVAKVMISQGANVNATAVNKIGLAPLHSALGNKAAISFLLEHGANPNLQAAGDRFNGLTPIQVALQFKEPPTEVIQLLSSKGGH